jgi:site-specific DNA recombinase
VQQMRLCAVAHLDALERPQHPLYRCLGSDAWRRLGGQVCDNPPVRQDLLDHVVWTEVVRLLEDPSLIQSELDRRLAPAKTADPAKQREKTLQRELARARKSMDRLLTAYQEDLLSLDELRRRMPELRQQDIRTSCIKARRK